ncbi:MAG: hypothetical protein AB1611_09945 [bacterium]
MNRASATVLTFRPNQLNSSIPIDLWDLDHGKYYLWGMSGNMPTQETIVSASLFIDNINDWAVEPDDRLYIHLLDNPSPGVRVRSDSEGGGDNFLNQGILLTTYTDHNETGPQQRNNPPEDWRYVFTAAQLDIFKDYAGNGIWGLGLDPDCHYYNDGITFTVETAPVPTPLPSNWLLFLAGLVGLAGTRRKLW